MNASRPSVPLHVLILPDFERADRIGSYWGNPKTRAFAELLIDCEEDRTLRAVLIGLLREKRQVPRTLGDPESAPVLTCQAEGGPSHRFAGTVAR